MANWYVFNFIDFDATHFLRLMFLLNELLHSALKHTRLTFLNRFVDFYCSGKV